MKIFEYVLRSTIMLVVLIGMNYSVATTRQAILEEATSMTLYIATLYRQLYQVQLLRWAFLGFLLTPTFLIIFQVPFLFKYNSLISSSHLLLCLHDAFSLRRVLHICLQPFFLYFNINIYIITSRHDEPPSYIKGTVV